MTTYAIQTAFPTFQDIDGQPLHDGFIYIGVSGLDAVTNPISVYFDESLTDIASQPIRTSNGSAVNAGSQAQLFVGADDYSITIQNKNNTLIYSLLSGGVGLPVVRDGVMSVFDTFASLSASSAVVGSWAETKGYHVAGDGGGGRYLIDNTTTSDLGNPLLANGNVGALQIDGAVNIRQFGAVADSTLTTMGTNNAPIIQAVVDYLAASGGRIYTPAVTQAGMFYGLEKPNSSTACVTVTTDGLCFSGDGPSSIWKTYIDEDIPLHFSSDADITNPSPSGDIVSDFEVDGMHIKGTGNYVNLGLAEGRGILFRNAKNVSVHDNTITDMTMIGICSEGGDGYFRVQNNQIHDCKYTGINYNGRCYQSIISGNIVSRCNAEVNSVAIQATGHCIITDNTVMGEITNSANCGGISWGEGNYDGIGVIANNLVKHVSFGIKTIFHGSCNITGNTIINALTQGGISLVGTATGGFTVGNSDDICANNLIINCAPYGIVCSAANSVINGNKIRTFTPILNPSAGTEPDAIVGASTNQGIRIRESGCAISNNAISGCTHGLTTTIDLENGIVGSNTFDNNTFDYSVESALSGVIAATGHAVIEREQATSEVFRERIFRSALPSQGYFPLSSEWTDPTPSVGAPVGQIILFASKQTAAAQAVAGATVIELVSVAGWFAGAAASVVGVELDNGAWHWTTVTVVASPNITIGTAIPAGRTVEIGANVFYNQWRPLANLA